MSFNNDIVNWMNDNFSMAVIVCQLIKLFRSLSIDRLLVLMVIFLLSGFNVIIFLQGLRTVVEYIFMNMQNIVIVILDQALLENELCS
jgi:hypothetical protein